MNQNSQDELPDLRRLANRIRDAYTLTEAEGVLEWFINAHTQKAVTEAKYEAIRNHYDAKYLAQVVNDYLDIRKQELNDLEATLTNQDRSTE